jgi:hypothetical protein
MVVMPLWLGLDLLEIILYRLTIISHNHVMVEVTVVAAKENHMVGDFLQDLVEEDFRLRMDL